MEDASELTEKLYVRCCIAGGGRARMTLGLLLARAGVEVMVLDPASPQSGLLRFSSIPIRS
jgi:2-polyprenyl-6-methoxyphenol hydroxylase-like FAD-dependent oxidoreductase